MLARLRRISFGISGCHWRQVVGSVLVLAGIAGMLAGCGGSPRERYQTLSVFFDGVPNPDAVKKEAVSEGGTAAVVARVVAQHPPYRDNKCDACHRGSNGELEDFKEAYKKCIVCHKTLASEHR